uniref:NADH-ubiquinone oxidoreductase chain 6 n=1 Tax=Pyrhila pisum TaxID=1550678 RepID=A0A159ZLR9_PYRPS|nr:NADH dehydrogenase subunit 6 [Pyrhila pisum]AMY96230.1 NADH dehydrogenase subunit 6 [Pyrhila pisum]
MFTLMIFVSLNLSILFTQLINPLSMGLLLLIQTVIISVLSGMMMYSYWFSYILFMIFVGGLLVLFIYVSSLASNQHFKFSSLMMSIMMIMMVMGIILLIIDPVMTNFLSLLPTSSALDNLSTIKINSCLYNKPIMNFTLFIVLYLLLTLIVVVKIANMFKLSLRLIN